jgi:Major tropism determinant N-terminal domain
MSEQLQLRRGTASQVTSGAPAQGEPWVDTTNNRICIGDGSTAGGWPAAKLAEVVTNTRTAVLDAAYSALTTDRMIAYTALTAARAVALPAASAFPTGTRLLVIDETGNCSSTLSITLNRAGSDTIGGGTSVVINQAYGFAAIESNGSNAWTVIDQGFELPLETLAEGANGASIQAGVLEGSASGLSGSSVTTSVQIPANCIVLAVGARVTTAIAGATSYSVGVSGNTTQFGSALSIAAGSTNYGLIGPTAFYTATSIVLTAAGGSFTAGAVRLSVHYLLCAASAS